MALNIGNEDKDSLICHLVRVDQNIHKLGTNEWGIVVDENLEFQLAQWKIKDKLERSHCCITTFIHFYSMRMFILENLSFKNNIFYFLSCIVKTSWYVTGIFWSKFDQICNFFLLKIEEYAKYKLGRSHIENCC